MCIEVRGIQQRRRRGTNYQTVPACGYAASGRLAVHGEPCWVGGFALLTLPTLRQAPARGIAVDMQRCHALAPGGGKRHGGCARLHCRASGAMPAFAKVLCRATLSQPARPTPQASVPEQQALCQSVAREGGAPHSNTFSLQMNNLSRRWGRLDEDGPRDARVDETHLEMKLAAAMVAGVPPSARRGGGRCVSTACPRGGGGRFDGDQDRDSCALLLATDVAWRRPGYFGQQFGGNEVAEARIRCGTVALRRRSEMIGFCSSTGAAVSN